MKVRVSVTLIRAHCTRDNLVRPKNFLFQIVVECVEMSLKLFYILPLQLYRFTGESEYLLDQKECLRLGDFMRKTGKSLEFVE